MIILAANHSMLPTFVNTQYWNSKLQQSRLEKSVKRRVTLYKTYTIQQNYRNTNIVQEWLYYSELKTKRASER